MMASARRDQGMGLAGSRSRRKEPGIASMIRSDRVGRGERRAAKAKRPPRLDRRSPSGCRRRWSPSPHPPSPRSPAKAPCRLLMRRAPAHGLRVAGRSSRTSTPRSPTFRDRSAGARAARQLLAAVTDQLCLLTVASSGHNGSPRAEDQEHHHNGREQQRDDNVDRRRPRSPVDHDASGVGAHLKPPVARRPVASCGARGGPERESRR
jgi:hypothetical protein